MRIIKKPPLSKFRTGKFYEYQLPSGIPLVVYLTMSGRQRLWKTDPPMESLSEFDKQVVNKVVMPKMLLKYKYVEDRLFSRRSQKVLAHGRH